MNTLAGDVVEVTWAVRWWVAALVLLCAHEWVAAGVKWVADAWTGAVVPSWDELPEIRTTRTADAEPFAAAVVADFDAAVALCRPLPANVIPFPTGGEPS